MSTNEKEGSNGGKTNPEKTVKGGHNYKEKLNGNKQSRVWRVDTKSYLTSRKKTSQGRVLVTPK